MINRKRIGCLLGIISLCLCGCNQNTDIYLEEYGENTQKVEPVESMEVSETEERSRICYVYICGAVMNPGVYAMQEGSRIYEVIREAGGFTEGADETVVNQAEPVTDGMMIRIYTIDEAESLELEKRDVSEKFSGGDGRLDINKAGISELMTLPGIGSAKAEAIVSYRTEYGDFSDVEDLMNIPGIKEGIFAQIREHIKVNN